jgi:hypothetical protein
MGKISNKATGVVTAQQLSAGTAKHLSNGTSVTFLGSSFTADQITSKLQLLVTLRSDANAAKATAKTKIANEAAQLPALNAFMTAFKAYLRVTYGTSPDVLADFGMQPKTRAPLTVEAKAAAVAKGSATRAARHTMGSKQKKGIKGAVTGVLVTPITASTPSVTASGSPATPATSGGTNGTTGATPRTA